MFNLDKKINKSKQNNLLRGLLNSKTHFSIFNKNINIESIEENPEHNFYPEIQMDQVEVKSHEMEMRDMTMEEEKSIVISEEPSFLDLDNRFVFPDFIDRIKEHFYATYLIFN